MVLYLQLYIVHDFVLVNFWFIFTGHYTVQPPIAPLHGGAWFGLVTYAQISYGYSGRKEYAAEGCEEQRAVMSSQMQGNSWHKFAVVTATTTIQAILHTATIRIKHRFQRIKDILIESKKKLVMSNPFIPFQCLVSFDALLNYGRKHKGMTSNDNINDDDGRIDQR